MNTNHHLPSPRCAQIALLLPILDDLAIDAEDARQARVHLASCPHCQAERARYALIDEALRQRYSPVAIPRHRTEDIMRSITERATESRRHQPAHPPMRVRAVMSSISAIAAVALIAVLTILVFHNRVGPGMNLGQKQSSFTDTQGLFASISMVSPTEGWALGQITRTPHGKRSLKEVAFYHYLNGTWTPEYVTTHEDFSLGGISGFNGSISLDSPTDGWAVAHNFNQVSAMFHYTNGTWTEVQSIPILKLQGIAPHSVWAISGRDYNQNVISHFDGSTWTTQPITGLTSGTTAVIVDLTMNADNSGWALAALRKQDHSLLSFVVLRYSGTSWAPMSTVSTDPSYYFDSLAMVSDTEGWALGAQMDMSEHGNTTHVPLKPIVLHFANGIWTTTLLPVTRGFTTPTKIVMRSAADGWIIGENTSAYVGATTNNYQQHTVIWHYQGSQWQLAPFPALGFTVDSVTDLAFTANGIGWASGYTSDIPASLTVQDTDILAHAMPLLLTYHDGTWQIYKGA